MQPLVGIIMGSRSDWDTLRHTAETLDQLGVAYEVRVVSAHRTPDLLFDYAASAAGRALEVLIAGAGGAAHLVGEYEDYAALAEFVSGLDCVTYEFENVPVGTAVWLAQRVPVFPPPAALEVGQDRISEKTFFQQLGVPGPAFRAVDDRAG